MSVQLLLKQNKECDKIHCALDELDIPNEIVYTGGGFYIVKVLVNETLQIEINEHGAILSDPEMGGYFAILSGETKPKAIAKQIACFYKLNK
jgi:hypothetical protein